MSPKRTSGEQQFLAMSVANTGFLLDRLGQDCHALQFLRELTQNAIDAIHRTGRPGRIVWDQDPNYFDLGGVQKLCIIDNGDGMTGPQMVTFINQLSSSFGDQSMMGNYGVGAKIAAATRNHRGVVYLSWKDGQGSMIELCRDAHTGQYGLRQWQRADGSHGHYLPIEDRLKPDLIQDHGTMVVLLGHREDQNTMAPPRGVASPSRWISKYLNTRYFRFPEGITVSAREGWTEGPGRLRTLTGQEAWLRRHARASGTVGLSSATAHWWILEEDRTARRDAGFVESTGHVAALHQDELYELATGRSGISRLQQFGVTFGYRWVVLYLEPHESREGPITTNTARTALLVDGEPLPWAEWAEEFRARLPAEIDEFVRQKASAAVSTDHARAIRDRLKGIMRLFRTSGYEPPVWRTAAPTDAGDEEPEDERQARRLHGPLEEYQARGRHHDHHSIYAAFERTEAPPEARPRPDRFPQVRWVSVQDGTRAVGDIEDRAAKYLPEQNLLLVNADFRVFRDMTEYFDRQFSHQPGVHELSEDAVHSWFEQALVETVLGVQALRNSREWTDEDIAHALSEEALTVAVMQRYHVHFAVKRDLGSRLGARRGSRQSA